MYKKSVMHMQSCCFANLNLLLFDATIAIAVLVSQGPYSPKYTAC